MISIVIPAFNQLEYCRQCVQSILMNTDVPYKLILVDNGSTDGVGEFFDSVPGATVVHAPENRGFAGGVNLGLEHAEGHVLLLNSDTLVPQGWLGRLERALLRAPNIGMVGPRSNCVSGIQLIEGLAFNSLDEIDAFSADLAAREAGKLCDTNRLVGFCLLIRDEAFKKVGGLDEAYGIGNYEDDDYCLRVIQAGYRVCIAEDAFVFHYGGRTFIGMGIVEDAWRELMARNEALFQKKWSKAAASPRTGRGSIPKSVLMGEKKGMNLEIRPYRDEDRDEWMRVHAIIMSISHAWNYTIQERPPYEGHASTKLVALIDGQIVGLTDAQYENEAGEFCFQKDSCGGYVLEFGRLPEFSGHGIGKKLMDATVEDAKRLGFHRLEYWSQDRTAQRFYRRLGMKEIGRHYRFRIKPSQAVTDLMMKDYIGVEYLYCACVPEEWPIIKQKYEVIERPPLEPHLCVGFELRF